MKTVLTLCLAAIGSVALLSTTANAAEVTAPALPSVVHINQVVVVETGHRHYYHHRHYHHRRYYWRHHRRHYY